MMALLAFLLAAFSLPFMIREVPAGNIGVLWKRFDGGTQTDRVLGEGMQLILPWDLLYLYSARVHEYEQTYDTISSDGLAMAVQIDTRYRIDPKNAGYLHKYVGPDYPSVLIGSPIGAVAREVISLYTPEELYKEQRNGIQDKIVQEFTHEFNQTKLNKLGQQTDIQLIVISDVLIRAVRLPDAVSRAIERKAEQHQLMLEYEFRLAREELEKKRREVEAQGLRAYADAMPNGILPSYLLLRGIEATSELARSPNAKIVMFGSGNNDLPFVLNSLLNEQKAGGMAGDAAPAPAAAPHQAPATIGAAATPRLRREASEEVRKLLERLNPLSSRARAASDTIAPLAGAETAPSGPLPGSADPLPAVPPPTAAPPTH
jgi:regulator of protease activity HflC (stomatin/prohibitin superfamily)